VNAGKVINMREKFFLMVLVLTSSSLIFGSDAFCSIDKQLDKEVVKDLQKFRSQYHSTCLNCSDNSCALKTWPSEKSGDAAVCKILFCSPSYVSKVFKMPDGAKKGKSLITFDYLINNKGKIKGVDITKVKGMMNERQAYKYITSFAKKTSFEPLVIEGKKYQILSLSGQVIAVVLGPDDINKYQAHDQGLWRN
jgi:hypothetical protein